MGLNCRAGCTKVDGILLTVSLIGFYVFLKGQNCLHLQEINLSGVNVTMRSLKDMSEKCGKLKVKWLVCTGCPEKVGPMDNLCIHSNHNAVQGVLRKSPCRIHPFASLYTCEFQMYCNRISV